MGEASSILYPGDYAALLLLSADPARVVLPPPGPLPSPGGGGNACGCCPTGWFTDADDSIRFSVEVSGGPKTVIFQGRSRLANGEIVRFGQTLVGNSATVPVTAILPSGAGCVLGVGATVVGGTGDAVVCCLVELGTEEGGQFIPFATVYQGILTGCGITPRVHVIPDPTSSEIISNFLELPAGGPISFDTIPAPPPGYIMRITQLFATLDTTAAVGATQYAVDATGTFAAGWQASLTTPIPAGLTPIKLRCGIGEINGLVGANTYTWPLPYPVNFTEDILVGFERNAGAGAPVLTNVFVDYEYVKGFN